MGSRWHLGEGTGLRALGRAGLAVQGVLYLVLGGLGTQIAFGSEPEHADRDGALAAVARQPFGRFLLAGLAVGFAAHAVWRAVQAVLDPGDEAAGRGGWVRRASFLARALAYAALCAATLPFLRGGVQHGGQERDLTGRVLELPLGRWLVACVGAAVVAAACVQVSRAVTGRHLDTLRTEELGDATRRFVVALGVAGVAGRSALLLLVGGFLLRAGVYADPGEAAGIDSSLKRLAAQPYGSPLLAGVAVGLVAFGVHSLFEARYRKVGGSGGAAAGA